MARTRRTYEDRTIWAEPVEEIVLEVDDYTHKIGITRFDYGDTQDHFILDHFVIIGNQFSRTYTQRAVLTPLLDHLRKDLFRDLRREVPGNRTEEKQKLLIVKAMQELM